MEKFCRSLVAQAEQRMQRIGDALPQRTWTLFEWGILLGPIVFCAAAALYLAACGWALYNGYASFAGWPLRQIETLFPVYGLDARLAARLRDWAVVAWAALALCLIMRRPAAEQILRRLDWIYRWPGLPAVMALFLFHLGYAWAAPEQISAHGSVLGGHVPFNDANGHYQYPFWFTLDGTFNHWIMRRPLNCVMRLGLDLLAGWNPPRIIALQTALLGLSAWLLGLAALRRWGFCSAVVACALVFLLSKTFLPTFLAATPGQIWACLSLILCLDALYVKSRASAFCALAALTITLLVRMGTMFLLPAILCWILVRFWNGWRRAALHACLGLALMAACFGASQAVSTMYSKAGTQGANFAYTLAALSFGGKDWSDARTKYKERLVGKTEKEQARFLYAQAWENIRHDPKTIAAALADRAGAFCRDAPRFMQQAHAADKKGSFFWLLTALAFWRLWRSEPQQRIFWLSAMAGITASAAVVHFDDGDRILLPGYLFLGLFLAGGLQLAPCAAPRRVYQPAMILGGLLILLMFSAPALAWRFPPEAARFLRGYHAPPLAQDEVLVWGGGSMAGILVVPDDAPIPADVPAVPLSSFVANIKKSRVEQYQPLVTPLPPEPPFAFISSIASHGFHGCLIAPPDMLRRGDVPVWRVRYADLHPPGQYWKRVVTAEPISTGKTP
ncbi:MAG: hypothetical protein FWG17_01590 [Desulfovibrionaceae bacterium]|nr:hypothetical protein [Desulfovibrionaceae bacterium]